MLHGHVNVVLKPGIFYQDNPLFSSQYNVFRPLPNPWGLSHFDETLGHTGPRARGEACTPPPAKSG